MMNIAVVFPGQGSQSIGMLNDYVDEWPLVTETFQQAGDALGYDLWDIVVNGPEEKLNQTAITQPAMLAADVAIMRIMAQLCMVKPYALAGHSLGEYAALVAANAIDFVDAIKLVSLRGQLMQDAVPAGKGAMAAIIGLGDNELIEICEATTAAAGAPVEAVNFNSPGQIVIAGDAAAVEQAVAACKEAGAKRALPLPVSVPSHSSLMIPAAEKLAEALQDVSIKTPTLDVIQNVDVKSHDNPDDIKNALVKQLHKPVRWVQTIKIIADNADVILECGPGKVLTGLNKRTAKDVPCYSLSTPASMQKFLDTV